MTDVAAAAKRQLREQLRFRRRRVDQSDRDQWSNTIAERIMADSRWRDAQDIGGFVGRVEEPDTMMLLRRTLEAGKRLWLPRVIGVEPPTMQWVATLSLGDLRPGPFGILEPMPELDRAPGRVATLNLVLIPGLAFGRDGSRLGAGYGYYDRALETVRATDAVVRMGVSFETFLDPEEGEIPVVDHDIRMHAICTECDVIQCG